MPLPGRASAVPQSNVSRALGPCSLSGSWETALRAAGPGPELLASSSFGPLPYPGCQQKDPAARSAPAVGGHRAGREQRALGVSPADRAQLLSAVLLPTLTRHSPRMCPGLGEANSPLAFPAAPMIALTGEKHLIFQETDRERMLVSLSS